MLRSKVLLMNIQFIRVNNENVLNSWQLLYWSGLGKYFEQRNMFEKRFSFVEMI
jgi:hypothetical protein